MSPLGLELKKNLIALILQDKNYFSMVRTWQELNTTNHISIEVLIHSIMFKNSNFLSSVLKDLSVKEIAVCEV